MWSSVSVRITFRFSPVGPRTMVSNASVTLINVGFTDPYSVATSSSAASQVDRTVPMSCPKHSVQVLLEHAFPS